MQGATSVPICTSANVVNSLLLNGIVQCGAEGVPDGCMSSHWLNPSPRVGFSWDPLGDGKSTLRGGYGIFYENGTADEANTGSLDASAPKVLDMTVNYPESWSGFTLGANAYPINVTSIPRKAVWTNVQQWSLSIERQLPLKSLLTVAYVGSKGTHLTEEQQLDQFEPVSKANNPFHTGQPLIRPSVKTGDCTTNTAVGTTGYTLLNGTTIPTSDPRYANLAVVCGKDPNAFRNYMNFGQVYSLENGANSSYNALQATLRRTVAPLTLGIVNTYSHSLDNSSDRSDATFVNSYDPAGNRANSNFDQQHKSELHLRGKSGLLRGQLLCNSACSALDADQCAESVCRLHRRHGVNARCRRCLHPRQ
jgi:hypothetical protein